MIFALSIFTKILNTKAFSTGVRGVLPALDITYTVKSQRVVEWLSDNTARTYGLDTESVPGGQGYAPEKCR